MKGLPGSGKSTKAKLYTDCTTFSADDFWQNNTFTPSMLSDANNWNRTRVTKAMKHDVICIVVDSCNINHIERRPYVDLAHKFGYDVKIVTPGTSWQNDPIVCHAKCVHDISLTTIKNMHNRTD